MSKVFPMAVTNHTTISKSNLTAHNRNYTVVNNDTKVNDDGRSEASSSLNSHHEIVLTEEQKTDNENAALAKKSAFIANRNEIRDRVLNEVMSAALPDAGAYDTDGTVKAKHSTDPSQCTQILKFLGIIDLDLHESVLAGSETCTRRAITKITKGKGANPALINQYDEKGRTALLIAVIINSLKLVDLLIDHKALTDICDANTGRTPLMYSVIAKNLEISHKLLNHGATPRMSDFKCITPLMLAANNRDLKHCKVYT